MSKKMMSIAILASLAMALPLGADAKERFSSSHEPFSAEMASRSEMDAYRKDLDTYVRDVDKQIDELLARRRDAVDQLPTRPSTRTIRKPSSIRIPCLTIPITAKPAVAAPIITTARAMLPRGKKLRKSANVTGSTPLSTI